MFQLLDDVTFVSSFHQKAPHTLHMRAGVKMGDASLQDSMVADGLTDAFHGYHMGITGVHSWEYTWTHDCRASVWVFVVVMNPVYPSQLRMWRSSGESAERSRTGSPSSPRTKLRQRRKQDILIKRSFQSWCRAEKVKSWSVICYLNHPSIWKKSFNLSLVCFHFNTRLLSPGPVEVKVDEFPRHGSNMESMSKLRPCFIKDSSGSVTAGNASGSRAGAFLTYDDVTDV